MPHSLHARADWDMNIDFLVSKPITFNIDTSSKTEGTDRIPRTAHRERHALSGFPHSGMAVNMVGDMAVNVIAPNGSWINVFDLETTFELKFEVRFRSCFLAEPALSLTGDLALWCPALLRQRIPGCAWQVLHCVLHHRHQGTCRRLAQ